MTLREYEQRLERAGEVHRAGFRLAAQVLGFTAGFRWARSWGDDVRFALRVGRAVGRCFR